ENVAETDEFTPPQNWDKKKGRSISLRPENDAQLPAAQSSPSSDSELGAEAVSFERSIFLSCCLRILPDLNLTTARCGITTSASGLFGFRPIRDLRTCTSRTPKLRNSTLRPSASAFWMMSRVN